MPVLETINLPGKALLGNDYYIFSNLPALKELILNGTGEGDIRSVIIEKTPQLEKLVLGGSCKKLSELNLDGEIGNKT